jgi:hypothetical protein
MTDIMNIETSDVDAQSDDEEMEMDGDRIIYGCATSRHSNYDAILYLYSHLI